MGQFNKKIYNKIDDFSAVVVEKYLPRREGFRPVRASTTCEITIFCIVLNVLENWLKETIHTNWVQQTSRNLFVWFWLLPDERGSRTHLIYLSKAMW